ncbi:MAG: hypothetical protein P4L84_07205 [Isosphaeraceae bacterium]|nr:hypothetical protein [Isosphaeraceae bacterium]
MPTVVFFEKPGCSTNARQRQWLERSGHTVVARSLLTETWTAERLRAFFSTLPVSDWFNTASPRVKSGEIDPHGTEPETALALLLADPLLIRRPLLEIDSLRVVRFDIQRLQTSIGLEERDAKVAETCSGGRDALRCSEGQR